MILLIIVVVLLLIILLQKSKFGNIFINGGESSIPSYDQNGPNWIELNYTLPSTYFSSGTPGADTMYSLYPYIYLFLRSESGLVNLSAVRNDPRYTKPSTTILGTNPSSITNTYYNPIAVDAGQNANNLLNLGNIWNSSLLNNSSNQQVINNDTTSINTVVSLRIPGNLVLVPMTLDTEYIIGIAPVLSLKPLNNLVSNTWDNRRYGNFTYLSFNITNSSITEGVMGTIISISLTFSQLQIPGVII
jgi:hypothetical protein